MADRIEEVVVQVSDLEVVQGAVSNLYYLSVSLDLQEQYRKLDARSTTSALTVQAEDALRKVNAALKLAEGDEEGDENEGTTDTEESV